METANLTKILVTTDFSVDASYAFPYAASLARRHSAEMLILHVETSSTEHPDDGLADEGHLSATALSEQNLGWRVSRMQLIGTNGIRVRREIVRARSAAEGILKRAKAERPDLIVMSSRGQCVAAQMMLGSVCLKVIAAAPCPVLIVKHDDLGMLNPTNGNVRIARILVPTDFSEVANEAVKQAARIAKDYDAEIHVLHVVHFDVPATIFIPPGRPSVYHLDSELRERITTGLRGLVEQTGLQSERVTIHVEEGSPAKSIADYAESRDVDLVVLSRKSQADSSYLLGGVTGRLVHEIHRPLLVV